MVPQWLIESTFQGQARPQTLTSLPHSMAAWGLHESGQSVAVWHWIMQLAWLPLHESAHWPLVPAQSTVQLELPLHTTLQSLPVQRK
jgi:hypothetical protein